MLLDSDGGALWLFAEGSEANRAISAGDLAAAEHALDAIRTRLEAGGGDAARPRLQIIYHQLGMVAEHRGDLPGAERWYGRSLEISEALGERRIIAASYHYLGSVALRRGDLPGAERWYRRSLEIKEALGDRPGMALSNHQLGMLAQRRGNLPGAEWWCRRSLEIKEALGDRPGMAASYHQLGIVAQRRGDLPGAERWYRRSLEISEALGDRPAMAAIYGQLGLLAEARADAAVALEWTVRCIALFNEFPHPSTDPGPHHLTRLTRSLGIPELEAAWRKVTGNSLPEAVRAGVESLMAALPSA